MKTFLFSYLHRASAAAVLVCLIACEDKVPLRDNPAQFTVAAAHWFENEKTQYVFFSVDGMRPGLASATGPSRFELRSAGLVIPGLVYKSDGYAQIDYSKGVHAHQLVQCGPARLCGSFSFKADAPAASLTIRYLYNSQGDMSVETSIPNARHAAASGAYAQSAFVYGTFNQGNDRLQIRVHDNFGSPSDEEVRGFGMTRNFSVSAVGLDAVSDREHRESASRSGTPFLFPSDSCAARLPARSGSTPGLASEGLVHKFSGRESWWPTGLNAANPAGSACFDVAFRSHSGEILRSASAVARRNPVLQDAPLTLASPTRPARKIPLVFSYCDGKGTALSSAPFLDYQRYILGIENAPIDACFAVGEEARFDDDMNRAIVNAIARARAQSGPNGADFIFAVVINQRMAPIIVRFHELIADRLKRAIANEQMMASPRLAGAFVYDSQAPEMRNIKPGPGVIWCPRMEKAQASAEDANCDPSGGGDAQFGPFNFLISMGPFPTLDTYVAYRAKYGEGGRVNNPRLDLSAVRTNEASFSDSSSATFFDGESISVPTGEGMRFCSERDSSRMLSGLAFRDVAAPPGSRPMNVQDAQALTIANQQNVTLKVGLYWSHPFLGALRFDRPIDASAFGVIPFSFSRSVVAGVGEANWRRSSWPVGKLMQNCLRYCSHPYFDEAGVYQISQNWAEANRCPSPAPAEPPQ